MADELIRCQDVKRMTTLSVRKIQQMAAAGELPSAGRLGHIWTFDPDAIRAWIVKQREKVCPPSSQITATSGATRFGVVSRSPDVSIDQAYEHLIRGKRKSASRHG
jgi:predicted DNA-binding transcriptional regulator AlpA